MVDILKFKIGTISESDELVGHTPLDKATYCDESD